ncbi:hypothetical protein EW146_g3175 [Bondarzewia mesenterica]|uniref:Uncharacterized protein n=1 Tax=Bondarzewia mesenterica TaxID=1095465 RepID=A0A4S4LYT2_9AGAM|nr:hypothetical protein EW146_g3175 [Bondarzewia mesenterica]
MPTTKSKAALISKRIAEDTGPGVFHASVNPTKHISSKLNLKCSEADMIHSYSPSSSEGEPYSGMSADESDSFDIQRQPSSSPRIRRSSFSRTEATRSATPSVPTRPPSTSSWTDLDLSVVVALVAPVGNWLTGNDHIKNLFLVLLLIVYLHQVIQVPWELYHSARTRHPHPSISPYDPDDSTKRIADLAATELRRLELVYLLVSIVSPFIGAFLLRYVLATLSGVDAISWFSTTLFVLATGIRPWAHLIARLRDRTNALHDAIHYPSPDAQLIADSKLQAVMANVEKLEEELAIVKGAMAARVRVEEAYEDLNVALEDVERTVRQHERKADSMRAAYETRLAAVEIGVRAAADRRGDKAQVRLVLPDPTSYASVHDHSQPYFLTILMRWIYVFWSVVTLNFSYESVDSRARTRHVTAGNGKASLHRTQSPQRLETILEDVCEGDGRGQSGDDSEEEESPEGRPDERYVRKRPPRHASRTFVDLVSDVVTLPYHLSLRILMAIAPPVQRLVT